MENKPKQTAVEWLVGQMIYQMDIRIENTTIGCELFEQAKEMEKQQIIETARFYFHERGKAKPEQYYKQEYAKNTNN